MNVKFYLIRKDTREIKGILMATMLIEEITHFVIKNEKDEFETIPVSNEYEIKRVDLDES